MHLAYGPELLGAEMGVLILALEEELCPVTFGLQKREKDWKGIENKIKGVG